MRRHVLCVAILGLTFGPAPAAQAPRFEARFILPPQEEHVHSSSIVELPNGDLFAVYYRGSGERRADDVRLEGARLPKTATAWSAPFPVADTPGFPDCNPVAFVDARGRLWAIWPAIVDNNWESAILRYRVAPTAGWSDGPPPWNDGGIILLRPDTLQQKLEPFAKSALDSGLLPAADRAEVARFMGRLSDKLYNRLGWMPRAHLLQLPSGRLLLPLYSDTYNVGLVAVSDDGGAHWRSGDPIVSLGGVQPSLVRRRDGTIVAFMRDNGPPPQRVIVAESNDEGLTWTTGRDSDIQSRVERRGRRARRRLVGDGEQRHRERARAAVGVAIDRRGPDVAGAAADRGHGRRLVFLPVGHPDRGRPRARELQLRGAGGRRGRQTPGGDQARGARPGVGGDGAAA